MLSPYSLARPGGVQGQVIGLARSLRMSGHQVTVLAPAGRGDEVPAAAGEHYVIGRPVALHSNGSVAPVALWPTAAARAERFVRTGDFDVVHLHEPLAPMASYGFVLKAPLPMVGTYHRAGVSRWVRPLRPLAELVGRRMQVRVAVSEAARETALRSGGGDFEVLFNGVDMERFESAPPHRDAEGQARRTVSRPPRGTQGPARPPRCLRHDGAARRPVGGGRRSGHRGAAPAASPVGSGALAGRAERRGGGLPPGRGGRAVCTLAARGVLRHGAARGDGRRLHGGGLRHRGLSHGVGRPCHAGCSRRRPCAGPRPGRRAGRCRRALDGGGPQGGDRVRPGLVDGDAGRTLRGDLCAGDRVLRRRATPATRTDPVRGR